MATQADYLRVLQSGPMPVTQMFREIYPNIGWKSQGCSNWSLDSLLAKGDVWLVRISGSWDARYTQYTYHSDPLRSRARVWLMLKEHGEHLRDIGVLQAVEVPSAYYRKDPKTTRYILAPGRSFSSCNICGGHETEGLHRTKHDGIRHRECQSNR